MIFAVSSGTGGTSRPFPRVTGPSCARRRTRAGRAVWPDACRAGRVDPHGADLAVTGWDARGGQAPVPAGMLAELAALRAALPGYDVILTSRSPAYRYEAIRRDLGPGTWCVVSTDPPTCGGNSRAAPAPTPASRQAAADPDRLARRPGITRQSPPGPRVLPTTHEEVTPSMPCAPAAPSHGLVQRPARTTGLRVLTAVAVTAIAATLAFASTTGPKPARSAPTPLVVR